MACAQGVNWLEAGQNPGLAAWPWTPPGRPAVRSGRRLYSAHQIRHATPVDLVSSSYRPERALMHDMRVIWRCSRVCGGQQLPGVRAISARRSAVVPGRDGRSAPWPEPGGLAGRRGPPDFPDPHVCQQAPYRTRFCPGSCRGGNSSEGWDITYCAGPQFAVTMRAIPGHFPGSVSECGGSQPPPT